MSLSNSAISSHTTKLFFPTISPPPPPPLPPCLVVFSNYCSKTHYSLWLKFMKNSIKITHMIYHAILSYFLVKFSHFPAFCMIFGMSILNLAKNIRKLTNFRQTFWRKNVRYFSMLFWNWGVLDSSFRSWRGKISFVLWWYGRSWTNFNHFSSFRCDFPALRLSRVW